MIATTLDLWNLTRGRPQIDPHDLADAVAVQAAEEDLDYRTRLLIRDSVDALRSYWGDKAVEAWLAGIPTQHEIRTICQEEFDKVGFPSLRRRLMDKTDPVTVRQYLDHVGSQLHHEVCIDVAGAIALILPGYLSRKTDDIDVVDEVPAEIRNNHVLMDALEMSYGLHMRHVQSHYFPARWQDRLHSLGAFGRLHVHLMDVYDVFLSKLFSARVKDVGDLRMLLPQLDKHTIVGKLKDTTGAFLAEPHLLELAKTNWRILFGEDLPQCP